MDVLKNLSIRSKLVLISLVPLLALMYFLYLSIESALDRKTTMLQVYSEFSEIDMMSRMLHELQIERGLVLSYLARQTEIDKGKLQEQTGSTDRTITEAENLFMLHKKPLPAASFFDSISIYRQSMTEHVTRVNKVKMNLLSEMGKTLRKSENAEIKNRLESHLFLLYSKEYFARLRSILASATSFGTFKEEQYGEFAVLKGATEINFQRFRETTTPSLMTFAEKKLTGESLALTKQTVDSIFADPDNLKELSHAHWWTHSTVVINLLKQIEDRSLADARLLADKELSAINRLVYVNLFIALAVIIAISSIVSITIRQIVLNINLIREAAEGITNGDVNVNVPIHSRDEIGSLAASFNKMIDATKKYAQVADDIGKGTYAVDVPVRGSADILGIALATMRTNLTKLAQDNEMRTWLLTGNSALNDAMRGDKHLRNLANDVIDVLTNYLNAQIGALYVRNNGHLTLTGSFAYDSKMTKSVIGIGEGLVGQVAARGKHLVVNEVPQDYMKINSGIGEGHPKSILVYPFKYEGEVKGVLEIGSTTEFSALSIQLLEIVSDNIGIAVHASQARGRMAQLLEETQRQAEELETQQEELRQYNEELQEKTEMLGRSDEELKAQQEQLQQTNKELSEKARLLNDQKQALEAAKLQIEEKVGELEMVNNYKSEFLANMSHELRTPLNSILILTQVLKENRNNSLTQKEIDFIKTIDHSGNDLLDLINQILDLSKIEAGKMELDVSDVSLRDIVRNMHTSFDEVARSKSITFASNLADSIASQVIVSDQQRIEQILRNFLSNAFKFTEPGGHVTLKIFKPESTAMLSSPTLKTATSIFAFSITDDGIGIDKTKQEAIFAAFHQADGSTKRKYGGTGLGLSISRQLCNLLGGEIQVESSEGMGSSFTLYISGNASVRPMTLANVVDKTNQITYANQMFSDSPALTLKDTHQEKDREREESNRNILIVEDDDSLASMLLEYVGARGYRGIHARDGKSAYEYARRHRPDGIILDLKISTRAGEVLNTLKGDPELCHIPVQVISGTGPEAHTLKKGALDIISRPVTKEAIWKALDRIDDFISGRPRKVLIIEDNKQHSQAVRALIESDGKVDCHSAYSAEEGLKMLGRDMYDCVIVDIGLPDMNGFTFLEQVHRSPELQGLPVIVYTGKVLSKEENSRLEQLADSVVLKTAHSHERLIDETSLFLHRVESNLPREKQRSVTKLHKSEDVLKGKTALIADDDPRNLFSLVTILEREGMECVTAENGKAVVEQLTATPNVDIILMDVMMPEMDGYDATVEIRQFERYKDIPIIALTARAMKGDREKCIAAGMSDYISKPLNVSQLISLMRVWLYR